MVMLLHYIRAATLAALLIPALAGAAPAQVKAVATFSILGDIVKNVGGDRVAVTTLVGPDGDAHVFQPSPGDVKQVAAAQVVFVNGLGLEGWMERLFQSAAYKGPVVTASQGIQPQTMEEEDEGAKKGAGPHLVIDPHAWQDLRNGQVYVENILAGLIQADPAGEAAYRANAAAYKAQLKELDAWVKGEIAAVPKPKRRVITSHDAFGYFGSAYGVAFLAPVGISTDAEPSAKGVASLIRQIRKEKIKALFVENITNPKLIEQIGKETGAKLGGALFSDALSKQGGPGDSYVKMFRNNVPLLKAAMLQN